MFFRSKRKGNVVWDKWKHQSCEKTKLHLAIHEILYL